MNDILLSPLRLSELESLIEKSVARGLKDYFEKNKGTIYNDESDLLTIKEASDFLSLKVPTLYSLISRGDLPVMKKNGRCYFSKAELMDYLKSGRKKTNAELGADAKSERRGK